MDVLMHFGTKYHSGRYPYGSGDNPFQHDKRGFYNEYKVLNEKGMSQTEIAKYFDDKYYKSSGFMNTTRLRGWITIGREEQEKENITRASNLKDTGMSVKAISQEMSVPERTVYSWLEPERKAKLAKTRVIAEKVKDQIEEYAKDGKYLDVGKATELQLGCSRTQLNAALAILEDEGYKKMYPKFKQLGTNNSTNYILMVKDDAEWKDVMSNPDKITPVKGIQPTSPPEYFEPIPKPKSISSKRITINYAEDGGLEKDGVIEIRPGVEDLSLGDKNYAQVRIAVDGTHYLKGMAVYATDLPDGVDIRFNTNKTSDVDKMKVLKSMEKVKKNGKETDEIDEERPFGATVKRAGTYIDENGKTQQSAINIVNEDIDWDKWSKNLASQFLSKQNRGVAKKQLQLAYDRKEQEFDEINEITNPVLKKKLLEEFADSCDSDAVTLKAAPFPRQATHVILPVTTLKDTEVYAPNYDNGEEVVLVRYPHAGPFESPRLKVNNNNKEAIKVLGKTAENAIGINSKVAEQLSGADFDGDTVVVIPTKNQTIKTKSPLQELNGFDPKTRYKKTDSQVKTGEDGFRKQLEMGKVSNLITDMTIGGATDSEIARAVKHSMVVIDAEKHNLDWKQSYRDNGIAQLKEKYQGGSNSGASTLISKAKSEEHVGERKLVTSANDKEITEQQRKDFLAGKKVWKYTNREYLTTNVKPKDMTESQLETYREAVKEFKANGTIPENTNGIKFKVTPAQTKSTKMAEHDDAFELSSGSPIETIYATHANKLKTLANKARKEALETKYTPYSPSAKKTYAKEVASLNKHLTEAQLNSPLERQAVAISNKILKSKLEEDPDLKLDKDAYKKAKNRAISSARAMVGAKKKEIVISEKEWEAIQSGAISSSKQKEIFANTNDKELKKLATPKKDTGMSSAQISRAKRLLKSDYSQAEVAEALGISVAKLKKYVDF